MTRLFLIGLAWLCYWPCYNAQATPAPQSPPQSKATAKTWTASEQKLLRSLSLTQLEAPIADWRNPLLGNPQAAALGERLFSDVRLSGNHKIACATCHQPDNIFQDGLPKARGLGRLQRNTPSLIGVRNHRWWYWDGRKDSLWSQALEPLEMRTEMGSTRAAVVRMLINDPSYTAQYEKLFGPLPDLSGLRMQHAGPNGNWLQRRRWQALPAAAQEAINRVFMRVGQLIAAFESTLKLPRTSFDCYVDNLAGGSSAECDFKPQQIEGLTVFISGSSGCVNCHLGPRFTDGEFRNVGTGTRDTGRENGISRLARDPYACNTRLLPSERRCEHLHSLQAVELARLQKGAFRTPGLRMVGETAPYMHDGRFATLHEVIAHYQNPPRSEGFIHELAPVRELSPTDVENLVAFLQSLSPE